jgi:hypothetical protein
VTTGTKPVSLGPLRGLLYTLRWEQPCRVSQAAVHSAHLLVSDEPWTVEIEQLEKVSGARV